jgi:hypothetical protein
MVRVDCKPLGLGCPDFADVFVGDQAAQRFEPTSIIVGIDEVVEMGCQLGMAVIVIAFDGCLLDGVSLELGGKSADIVLPGADMDRAVADCVTTLLRNSGQSCNAPTRLLVPSENLEQAIGVARRTAEAIVLGDPTDANTQMGRVVSKMQYDRIQSLIQAGIDEGAVLDAVMGRRLKR